MPEKNPEALEFLATRRSRPAKTLGHPIPKRDELEAILTVAARTPDHGALVPWRFIVLNNWACRRLSHAVGEHGKATGREPDQIAKASTQFAMAYLVVAVVSSPKPTEKFPQIEQTLSAGAVCLALVNAALASGWGANWLTGWAAHDPDFVGPHLGLEPHESIAGFIHVGTETTTPAERPRPDVSSITTWVEE